MKVADILALKRRPIVTVKPTDTIETLSTRLRENRIGAIVVSNDGRSIDGVISERDLAYAISKHKAGLHTLPVSELMTKTVFTCKPTDDVAVVGATMMSRGVRHLPVEDDKVLVGMVSIRDVLNLRVDELQQKAAHLHAFANEISRPPMDRE